MSDEPDGGDAACWADKFPEYLGLDAPEAPAEDEETDAPDERAPRDP